MVKKIISKEGDLFAVPLNDEHYGIGLIAKKNKKILLGYFFKTTLAFPLEEFSILNIQKDEVILITKFSSLGIDNEKWPILKKSFLFKKDEWPIPTFKMQDLISNQYFAVVYNEDLLNEKRFPIDENVANSLYASGLCGYIYLEKILSKLLQ